MRRMPMGALPHQGRMRGFRTDLGSSTGKGATTPSITMQKDMTQTKRNMQNEVFIVLLLVLISKNLKKVNCNLFLGDINKTEVLYWFHAKLFHSCWTIKFPDNYD